MSGSVPLEKRDHCAAQVRARFSPSLITSRFALVSCNRHSFACVSVLTVGGWFYRFVIDIKLIGKQQNRPEFRTPLCTYDGISYVLNPEHEIDAVVIVLTRILSPCCVTRPSKVSIHQNHCNQALGNYFTPTRLKCV